MNFRIALQCFLEVEKFRLLACDKLDNFLVQGRSKSLDSLEKG